MKTGHNSLLSVAVELKKNHLSDPACTCNPPPLVIRGGKANLSF